MRRLATRCTSRGRRCCISRRRSQRWTTAARPRSTNHSAFVTGGNNSSRCQYKTSSFPTRVTLYTKDDCTLCVPVKHIIRKTQERLGFDYREVDITAQGNEKWHELYKHDIPVVHVADKEFARHRLRETDFVSAVQKHMSEQERDFSAGDTDKPCTSTTNCNQFDPLPVFQATNWRVMYAPMRYVQGPGVADQLGQLMWLSGILPRSKRKVETVSAGAAGGGIVALIGSPSGLARDGVGYRLQGSIREECADVRCIQLHTSGKCTRAKVEQLANQLTALVPRSGPVRAVVAVGAGSCIDTVKCVASRLQTDCVVFPTAASTDAPCSAVSVIYNDAGEYEAGEHSPRSPTLVAVDTQVIAKAPLRSMVAGMGDALATFYEAKACEELSSSSSCAVRSYVGAVQPAIALAIGQAARDVIRQDGSTAYRELELQHMSQEQPQSSAALERIVEANTLLSGLGFESGGTAHAHGIAAALTSVPLTTETPLGQQLRSLWHGEQVGLGLLTQLLLGYGQSLPAQSKDTVTENKEYEDTARFMTGVGLPVALSELMRFGTALPSTTQSDHGAAAALQADLRTVVQHVAHRAEQHSFVRKFGTSAATIELALWQMEDAGLRVSQQYGGGASLRRNYGIDL